MSTSQGYVKNTLKNPDGTDATSGQVSGIAFKTSDNLAANASISTGWIAYNQYASGTTVLFSDVASAINGLTYEYSIDGGLSVIDTLSTSFTTLNDFRVSTYPLSKGTHVRITYTNGNTPQSDFYFAVVLNLDLVNSQGSVFTKVNTANIASINKTFLQIPDSNLNTASYDFITRTDNSLNVNVTNNLPTGTNSIGQVTVNAGTNVNTSLLALDSTVAKDASLTTINNTLGLIKSKTDNIDVALSTRTKASDIQSITGFVSISNPTTNPETGLSKDVNTQLTNTKLDTLNSKDFATQTTLAALNAKVTAVNTGAVTISTALPTGANVIGALTANQTISGTTAHSTATTVNPVPTGGKVIPTTIATTDTTLAANDTSWIPITTGYQQVVKNYSTSELDFTFNVSSPTTTTTVQRITPASGTASVRNFITSLTVHSDVVTLGGLCWILDGSLTVNSIAITTGLVTTSSAHDLKIGDAFVFTVLASGTDIFTNTIYYVTSVASTTTFNFSTSMGGANVVPTIAYTSSTMYRMLYQFKLQTVGLVSPTRITFPTPLKGLSNSTCNLLIPTSMLAGTIYLTINGYRGF